jgi:hypothetical protein
MNARHPGIDGIAGEATPGWKMEYLVKYALKLVFRLVVVGHRAAAISVVRNP